MATISSSPQDTAPRPAGLADVLLAIAPGGIMLLRPHYAAGTEELTDFTWEHLNATAQRLLHLPAQPAGSFLALFPTAEQVALFDFYRRAFLSGNLERHQTQYQHDGRAGYYTLTAQRYDNLLAVSLIDGQEQPLPGAEDTLRPPQADTGELKRGQQPPQFNQEPEARMAGRTEQLEARMAERTEQLAEQQELLRKILSQVPAIIATFSGPDHRTTFFNDSFQLLLGGRARLQQPLAENFPEIAEQGFVQVLDQVYASGQPYAGQEMAALLDQPIGPPRQHYFNFTYQPLTDRLNQVQGILVFAVDVTAQVRARRQAETLQAAMLAVAQRQAQQRQELYQIFEQTPVAIVLLREPDHRIDYFNSAFEGLFPPEEWAGGPLQGHTIGEVYPRIRQAGLVALLDGVFQTGVSQAVIDMPLANLQPGSPRYVTFAYQAYREAGRIVGVAAFIYDTTEQVLARQQVQALIADLQATNARLLRTNADLDTFVYSASHDLKSPITNIEGLLLALREQLPPEVKKAELVPKLLAMMDGAVHRFQQTLGHLTNVSRLQLAAAEQPETIDLPALVESVRLDILPELTAAGVTLTIELDSCPTVQFAAKNLRSILYNLLSNAVKYRDPDRPPLVQLRCHRDPAATHMTLEVQDNGLGLSPHQQRELFRLFRRLHTHVSGSGVGLYMVKKMVDNAGGTLTVQSEPGVGSTFTVVLPAAG